MTQEEVRIGGDRVGALIGKGGATKRELEEKTGAVIRVDSKEGLAIVEGENAEGVITAVEVIRAISRGFSPERAFLLLREEDAMLDVIDLTGIAETTAQLERIRGRIIGRDGRSREQIEEMTGAQISVFGKSVAMIGGHEQLKTSRTAIEMLINGVPHETVFSFLDKKKRETAQDLLGTYY